MDVDGYTDETAYFDLTNSPAGSWTATDGCKIVSTDNNGDGSWGGTSGGQCANIGDNGQDAIRFGWVSATLQQAQKVIDENLKHIGLSVGGYIYSWKVKNYNSNDTSTNQLAAQDPLFVRVIFTDTDGNVVHEDEYDYSYPIANWELKTDTVLLDPMLNSMDLDEIIVEAEGMDAGYWAGYWGPEFREAKVWTLYWYETPLDCSDPLNSPECPGYATALQEKQAAELAEQLAMVEESNEVVKEEPEPVLVEEIVEVVENAIEEVLESPMEVVGNDQGEVSDDVDVGPERSSNVRGNPLDVARDAIAETDAVANNAVSNAIEQAGSTESYSQTQSQQSATQSAEIDQQLTTNVLDDVANLSMQQSNLLMDIQENIQQSDRMQSAMGLAEAELLSDETLNQNILLVQIELTNLEVDLDTLRQSSQVIAQTIVQDQQEEQLEEGLSAGEEADLVAKAFAGSDDEDAKAALLGYNPLFSQYTAAQLADADFYKDKEIYPNQKNHDNPQGRFFNGASDELHRQMVRQQYERN